MTWGEMGTLEQGLSDLCVISLMWKASHTQLSGPTPRVPDPLGLGSGAIIRVPNYWTVVLEKTLESPLDYKEIQPVYPKADQSWIFIGRTDADTLILWPPDAKNWLIGKDPDAGRDWGQEEKGMTEDEMVAWHHRLKGHEFEQALGAGDGQGGLACCSPWGRRESDMTEQLNWTEQVPRGRSCCFSEDYSLWTTVLKYKKELNGNNAFLLSVLLSFWKTVNKEEGLNVQFMKRTYHSFKTILTLQRRLRSSGGKS